MTKGCLDTGLQQQYTMKLKNEHAELYAENYSATEKYTALI